MPFWLYVMPQQAHSFVLIGPMFPVAAPVGFNISDDLGGPKEIKHFFRWNNPYLTYTFDQSFVRYFGLEGMEAIHDAFRVVNDFFIPADGSYKGVSSMDFARDGYLSNYNTTWVNTTAQNDQIIDIKSLALGMVLNQLGVGNPHRYAYTVRGVTTNTTGTQWSFDVRLLNFDPQTWQPTDVINGVQYSYRLIHSAPPQAGGLITVPTTPRVQVDMEEFTTDTSGNAWTSVAGIADAFYGSTAIYWTDTPTAFNFGVYYDGRNAMGGQFQPRHALTYDDAGALKYLYRTNNFVYEDLELAVNLVEPPQFLSKPDRKHFLQSNMPQGRGVIPRRSGGNVPPLQPAFATTHPLRGVPIIGFPGQLSQMVGPALRGGIDRMQFYYQPLDSLLGTLFTPTNFIWTDTFVTTNGNNVQGLGVTTPGSSAWIGQPNLSYYSQKVGRTVTAPDIIFVCDDLGQAPDGVPVAWHRTGHVQGSNITEGWTNNGAWANVGLVALNTTNTVGPGNIFVPPNGIIYTFARMGEGFEVVWSGETSVVGNQTQPFSLWGHIRGPGPLDVTVFPRDTTMWRLENEISPKTAPPIITMISDNGGLNPIATNSFTRTQETISIIGSGMASVTAIEVLSGDKVVQTIFQADKFKVSGQRIDIPPGVLDEQAEGSARTIRVWNTVGASEKSPQQFNIYTGRAVVIGTSMDGRTFDRAQPLTVYGYGFKSLKTRTADGNASLTYVRLEDGLGNLVVPQSGNAAAAKWEVVSDTQAVLPVSTFNYQADGSLRRIRVSRGSSSGDISSTLSSTNNVQLINWITTKPTITGLESIDLNGTRSDIGPSFALRRDRAIDINGTALNTALAIEVVKQDGTSFTNPVVINLPNAGVTVDDNGSRIQVSANVILYDDADGHAADQRYKFKVYNRIGNDIRNVAFNVNVQPSALSVAGFTLAHAFNRHHVIGDDITLTGTGLRAVSEIRMVDVNGVGLNGTPNLILPNPGVTVTANSISIDTSVAQFFNAALADSNSTTDWRRFRLISARDNVLTPAEHRFYVGLTPTYESLAGLTPGSLHYRRDADTMTFNGQNLGIISRVEIVDINGNPIPGVGGIDTASGITRTGNSQFNVSTDSFSQTHLLDSVTMDKRVRVHTPFGTATSAADGDGMFTISAMPVITGFTGAGWDNANERFDASKGDLILYGKNFRGIKQLVFDDDSSGVYINIPLDARAPPPGVTVNAEGTLLTISSAFWDVNGQHWLRSGGTKARRLRVTGAANQDNNTSFFETRDRLGNSLLNGTALPVIITHPQGRFLTVGDSFNLDVNATGAVDMNASGVYAYQWRKDGVNIAGANYASYTDISAALSDAGQYSVALSNAGGTVYSQNAQVTVDPNLVGFLSHYKFYNDASDSQGGDHNGTVSGASLTTDRLDNNNSAYSFDGVNDTITASDALYPTGSSARTVTAWIKTTDSSGWQDIFTYGTGNNNQSLNFGTRDGQLFVSSWGGSNERWASGVYVNSGQWTHVAFTLSSAGSLKFYVNGDLNATMSLTPNTVLGGTSAIGNRFDGNHEPWNGSIDEVRIYGSELSSAEIAAVWAEDMVDEVSAGWHSFAVKADGSLWGWGENVGGRVGDGTSTTRYAPVKILTGIKSVSAGSDNSNPFALDTNGTLWTWGGGTTPGNLPAKFAGITGVVDVNVGFGNLVVALKSDGTVWAWGYNVHGEVGNGTVGGSYSTPQQVTGLTGITAISSSWTHSLALKSDGTVYAWGRNQYGQLGDGTYNGRASPVSVSGLANITSIAAGGYHSLAVKTDGTVWAWGRAGSGTPTETLTPIQVSGLANIQTVAAGDYHSMALKTDGTVWCWGNGSSGSLGNGTWGGSASPVQSNITGVQKIAGGHHTSFAIKSGSLWAWGNNGGQPRLGDGTNINRSSPVKITVGP